MFGHDGLMLAKSKSSGNGEDEGEIPDNGVGGADDLLVGATRRLFSGSSCLAFSAGSKQGHLQAEITCNWYATG